MALPTKSNDISFIKNGEIFSKFVTFGLKVLYKIPCSCGKVYFGEKEKLIRRP